MSLFRRRSIEDLQGSSDATTGLKRSLNAINLTLLGVGATIGSGIFVLTGTAAALNAGPAIALSFVLTGTTAILVGLCYAEFASLIPISGSAYTYSIATLGEFPAWLIGWDLILEYGLGIVTVAIGWSGYFVSFLRDVGIDVPCVLTAATNTPVHCLDGTRATALLNLPALLIVVALVSLSIRGIRESASANAVAVVIKIAVISLFVLAAARSVKPANWHPFIPDNQGGNQFGWDGVVAGAGLVFFAYLGFDAVSTAAQEAKNPQRDVPVAIIGSVLMCTLLYVVVAVVVTGVVSYTELDVANPIGLAADRAGLGHMAALIKLGAIFGLAAVMLVLLIGQSRVVFSLASDGLLPAIAARVHPTFRTPYLSSMTLGALAAIAAAVVPLRDAAVLVSIGTLLAFLVVSVGILVLRHREPRRPRPFKTPAVFIVAPLAVVMTFYLMIHLGWRPWLRLGFWGALGIAIYGLYGHRHSTLAQGRRVPV